MTSEVKPWSKCSKFGCLLLFGIVLTLVLLYYIVSYHQGSQPALMDKNTEIPLRHTLKTNLKIVNNLKQNISIVNYFNSKSATKNHPKSNFVIATHREPNQSTEIEQFGENQHGQNNTLGGKNVFYRIDTTPESTIGLPFRKNFKNPCWREKVTNLTEGANRVRCLPYFYMVGAPKSGTSDMHSRLILHPSVSDKVEKEPHWIAHLRFHEKGKYGRLSNYLHYFDRAVKTDILTSRQENGRYDTIIGDCSCSTLWDNWNLLQTKMRRNMTIPPYTNADIIYNLNQRAKIIIMLRNPTPRLYSDYLSFQKFDISSWAFHNKVVKAIKEHTKCERENSLRFCIHIGHKKKIRLIIGMYYIFVEDYFRVFPREQIKIIKTEDFSQNIPKTMADVFKFLEIDDPPEDIWTQIIGQKKTNEGKKKYQYAGKMLPRTHQLLSQFYKPYNEKLAKLLGDDFLFVA